MNQHKQTLEEIDNNLIKLLNRLNNIKSIIDRSKTNLKKKYFLKKLKKIQQQIISLSTARSYVDGSLKAKDNL